MSDPLRYLRLLYRLPWLLLHTFLGTPLTVLCQAAPGRAIRFGGRALSEIMLKWWAATACRIFGVRRQVRGRLAPGSQLVAANHISWIDIQLLHSIAAMGFIAKAEIARWPVVGWLARAGRSGPGTVAAARGARPCSRRPRSRVRSSSPWC